ncbi:Alpha/Beta hydrolase protein [Lophiotrema nucula]|uniref:Alpha/Beta hydrolase protein n=1 Tax=Lophiotrema nucula TaxID=690887 RepID=A0A6A5ZBL0_9PLEO|nr:Alpha/Beta hydrolase protein [Lophiotrema nucula]
MLYPTPYIVDPQSNYVHTQTIILLHGRGSTAEQFAGDLFALKTSSPALNLPSHFPSVRWVFPDAGQMWCTAFKENRSAWFDTFSLTDLSKRQDLQVAGLRSNIQSVHEVVEEEIDKLGGRSENIILGGFSQGSATALWSLFTGAVASRGSLGAFVGLSAWMPFINDAKAVVGIDRPEAAQSQRIADLQSRFLDIVGLHGFVSTEAVQRCLSDMPVYLGHDTYDIPVSVTNCRELSVLLRALGMRIDAREYVGAPREGHWVKEPEQLDDIVEFLKGKIGL